MADNNGIDITVTTSYIASQSSPEHNIYVFSYTILIVNTSDSPSRLLNRHWVITDVNGKTQEVRGEGVVGQTPLLNPGEGFEYTSGTSLDTEMGTMSGDYQFITSDGVKFTTYIPSFLLSAPRVLH